jgi:alpha-amylase/alpha-mannosidase (GH57 family)
MSDPIYLNILWHQHQPLYKDPIKDTYTAPWVRLHSTKDYYDMAAILLNFPKSKINYKFNSFFINPITRLY